MEKYIDSEKLKTIIEERKTQQDQWVERYHDSINQGISNELSEILSLIDSLQKEQPKVDLNEEIERFIDAHYHTRFDETLENGNDPLTVFDFQDIARHFCEFGLRKAAEMYDEIEYNRQIAEEEKK